MVLILSLLIAISAISSPSERVDRFLLAISELPSQRIENLDFIQDGIARVLIKLSKPTGDLPGAKVRTVTGTVVSAQVPLSELHRLASSPYISFVQPASRLRFCQDWIEGGIKDIGADIVWNTNPAFTGRGTIIGVIDTGIDWSHPDFTNPDGSSKILFIWDQTVTIPGREPTDYGYGSQWSSSDIEAGICRELDTAGHGTHISGIASAIAPQAQIIAVKSHLFDDQIIDAVDYIFKKAQEVGMPAVVNMSFGGHRGPHDGRSLLDQGLMEIIASERGRAAVAAAGNDGGSLVHAGGTLPSPQGDQYPYLSFKAGVDDDEAHVEIWYGSGDRMEAKLLVPRDEGEFIEYGWVKPGGSIRVTLEEGFLKGAEVYIGSDSPHPLYPDLNRIEVWIWDGGDMAVPLDRAEFNLMLKGTGVKFDAYSLGLTRFTMGKDKMALRPDGEKSINSPASASDVIAVASYAVTNTWPNITGDYTTVDYARIGEISAFSSRGPLRDGGRKPDLAAPGQMIGAALSRVSWQRPGDILPDNEYVVLQGTSMAAPHVAGAIALLFEEDPNLSPSQVKARLISSALDMGRAGWDKLWGYGKLRVPELLGLPRPPKLVSLEPEDGKLTPRWTSVEEATGYLLEIDGRRMDVGDKTSYTIDGLENNKAVKVKIIAYNARGFESPPSNEMIGVPNEEGLDLAAPLPPRSIWLTPGDGRIEVGWRPCPEPDVAGYKIYWGTEPGKYGNSATVKGATKYLITDLRNGLPVYVAVSAFDSSGNEGTLSEELSAVPRYYDYEEPRQMPGSPFELKGDSVGSPLMCDLTGDDIPELIVSSSSGKIQARTYVQGVRLIWDLDLGKPIRSVPAAVDLDGDGTLELIVAAGETLRLISSGGDVLWKLKFDSEILTSPTISDMEGDGENEIVVPLAGGTIHLIDPKGNEERTWKVEGEEFRVSPAIADLNLDGKPEVIIPSRHELYVFSHSGREIWRFAPPDGCGDASPIVSDFNEDGLPEVILASGTGNVYMLNAFGRAIWMNETTYTVCGLSAGDMDGNGLPEIVAANQVGELYVWKADGDPLYGFPVQLMDKSFGVPLILDLDGDGDQELLIGVARGNSEGFTYGLETNGELISGFPLVSYLFVNTPAVGDLDGDGDIEVVVSTMGGYADKAEVNVWDLGLPYIEDSVEWGTPRRDRSNSGFYPVQVDPHGVIARLKRMKWGGIKSGLLQNYPNPFNPETWIPFILTKPARVTIGIYDLQGRLIWRKVVGKCEPGLYISKEEAIRWDGRNLKGERVSSGLYIYSLQADLEVGKRIWKKRMALIR
jgi:subtilisin family serine protease